MVDVLRLRIDCAYDGSEFHGWARQPHLRTVQGVMEDCICRILHLDREKPPIRLVVAGRTDTGVHASRQTCHLDIEEQTLQRAVGHLTLEPMAALEHRLRHILPADIAIHRISLAPPGFDARFSALERVYVYRVSDSSTTYDPRLRHCVARVEGELDIEAMNSALFHCVGLHDFGSFATPNEGGTTIREVKSLQWHRIGIQDVRASADDISLQCGGLIALTIVADAFAHNMVRSLVQASLQIGLGKRDEGWFIEKLHHPKREGSTGPAAACGLTLERIAYPADEMLAERAERIRARRELPADSD